LNIALEYGTYPSLPTFQESEWTGPLLEKAAQIGNPKVYKSGPWFCKIVKIDDRFDEIGFGCSDDLNYAIAEAILEAEGK